MHTLLGKGHKVERGEKIGVVGHNGACKSTIMKIVANVLKPTSGEVKINGIVAPMQDRAVNQCGGDIIAILSAGDILEADACSTVSSISDQLNLWILPMEAIKTH